MSESSGKGLWHAAHSAFPMLVWRRHRLTVVAVLPGTGLVAQVRVSRENFEVVFLGTPWNNGCALRPTIRGAFENILENMPRFGPWGWAMAADIAVVLDLELKPADAPSWVALHIDQEMQAVDAAADRIMQKSLDATA